MYDLLASSGESSVVRPGEKAVLESCKPISVCTPCGAERIICLSDQYPGLIPLARDRNGPLPSPLFGLAPDGVFRAASLALRAVGSYPTFSPLPAAETSTAGGIFSVALSVGKPLDFAARVYRRPDRRYAASRPMVFGLSSPTRSRGLERFSALQNRRQLNSRSGGNKIRRESGKVTGKGENGKGGRGNKPVVMVGRSELNITRPRFFFFHCCPAAQSAAVRFISRV